MHTNKYQNLSTIQKLMLSFVLAATLAVTSAAPEPQRGRGPSIGVGESRGGLKIIAKYRLVIVTCCFNQRADTTREAAVTATTAPTAATTLTRPTTAAAATSTGTAATT